ncbi:MAG: hypothetical protein KF812_02850 [Fimbriimonadaceae bacterium]|nr:hypothetical protein [Fimbriimonadaceae bacterium]
MSEITARKTSISSTMMGIGALLLLAGGGLAAMTFGAAGNAFIKAFMFGYSFFLALTLGFQGLVFLHHCTRLKWSRPVLRLWESATSPAVYVALILGMIPIYLNLNVIYEWADPAIMAADPILQHKSKFLNPTMFLLCTFGYFALLLVVSGALAAWQRNEDKDGDLKWEAKRANLASPMILFFVIGNTFLYTIFLMSLDPHWFSTIYPAWITVGGALGALGFTSMMVGTQSKREPFIGVINEKFAYDIGTLSLAFTLLWTYFTFSQFLITWSGNLPEFTVWFINRSAAPFGFLSGVLIFGQFLLPFLLFLHPPTRRNPMLLAALGGWVFTIRFVDLFYIVVPSLHLPTVPYLPALAGFGLMGGIWFLLAGWQYTTKPLLVTGIAQEAAHHA